MNDILIRVSVMLIPALLAVMIHEVAHGCVAQKLGDPTARLLGRLTLNPFKHLDPLGVVALLVFGFGWAKPVPVNPRNLTSPKRDMIWVALAGPVSNLLLAGLSALVLHGMMLGARWSGLSATSPLLFVFRPVLYMVAFSLFINVNLAIFNLIPIPPLDGGRILAGVLPDRQAETLSKLEPCGFLIVILLISFTSFYSVALWPIIVRIIEALAGQQLSVVVNVMHLLLRST